MSDLVDVILRHQGLDKGDLGSTLCTTIHDLKGHYHHKTIQAILTATLDSLAQIQKRVGARTHTEFMRPGTPLFEVNMELHAPYLILNPSLDEVQSVVLRSARMVLQCAKYVEPFAEREGPMSGDIFHAVAHNPDVVKVLVLLTGCVQGLKKQVQDCLDLFKKFEYLWLLDSQRVGSTFVSGLFLSHKLPLPAYPSSSPQNDQRLMSIFSRGNVLVYHETLLQPPLCLFGHHPTL